MKPAFKPSLMIILTILALTFSALGVTPVHAAPLYATITVSNANDSGAGSLRQAIADVCAGGTITFNGNMTITLDSQLPAVAKAITITGNGAANTIVQANAASGVAAYRVFEVSAGGNLTLDGLTVQNGRCAGACATNTTRGGVYNAVGGTLTVTNSTFSGNTATQGGGIYNRGTLNMANSTLTGNISHNGAGLGSGGGFQNDTGTATLTNVTISGTLTLTAQWTINVYTVTFDSQSGTAVASQSVNYGDLVAEPT